MRPNNSQTNGRGPSAEGAPGSHLARRRPSESRLEAVGKRRDESGPPTKPSIAPPTPRPHGSSPGLGEASPLVQLERSAPTLTYSVIAALAVGALGVGTLMVAWSGGRQVISGIGGTLWFVAVTALIFSSLMALVITLSVTRRLEVLARVAWRLAQPRSEAPAPPPSRDALTSLAHSVTKLAERVDDLTAELVQCVEEEQARVDELVRERTRALSRESEDYRRLLGEGKGVMTLDRDGHVVAQSGSLESWLGSMPRTGQFWEYFERASLGVGSRFESAWGRAIGAVGGMPDLSQMPSSLRLGQRHLALEYTSVVDSAGRLERVLVLLSDVTIPEPDPATSSRQHGADTP